MKKSNYKFKIEERHKLSKSLVAKVIARFSGKPLYIFELFLLKEEGVAIEEKNLKPGDNHNYSDDYD